MSIIRLSGQARYPINIDAINQEQEIALYSFVERMGEQIGAAVASFIVGFMTPILANRRQL